MLPFEIIGCGDRTPVLFPGVPECLPQSCGFRSCINQQTLPGKAPLHREECRIFPFVGSDDRDDIRREHLSERFFRKGLRHLLHQRGTARSLNDLLRFGGILNPKSAAHCDSPVGQTRHSFPILPLPVLAFPCLKRVVLSESDPRELLRISVLPDGNRKSLSLLFLYDSVYCTICNL